MILVLYVPAIHQGYIELFNKYEHKVAKLYVLDEEIIEQFPLAKREIRAIKPQIARRLIKSADYFKVVELANSETLKILARQSNSIILSTEHISDYLIKTFFSKNKIIREPIFLRQDENTVKDARHEVRFEGIITDKEFQKQMMAKTFDIAMKSSDLFLRVGAALFPVDHPPLFAHNRRMPSPHEMSIVGDPRNYLPYGSDTHLRTTLHAEQAVIAQAAREGIKILNSEIYVTSFPCPDCCNNIAEAGIVRLYFKEGYSLLSSDDVLQAYGVHVVQVV